MQRSNTIIKNRTYTSNDVLHYFQLFNSNSHFTLKAQSHLTRRTVKDPSFIPSASCEPSLLKETLRTDSSMLQRASRVWSGRLHSLRQRDTRHQCGGRSTVQKVKCWSHWPDRTIVTSSDSNWLFGMQVEGPQLSLTVTLHQQNRFVPISNHDFKNLTVLGAC